MATIEDHLAAMATLPDGTKMSDERLKEVFGLVKTPGHWKDPIDMLVPKEKASVAEIRTAVAWYCGGYPEVEDYDSDFWRVRGEGYYIWIGA